MNPICNNTMVINIVVLLLCTQTVSSFLSFAQRSLPLTTISCKSIENHFTRFLQASNNQDNDDFGSIGNESYESDIDWDAEWKKVVEKRDQPTSRPGNYKNEVERAMLKTQKVTGEQIKKIKIVQPDINMKSLQSDGKFWIAILAVISIGISLISAAGVSTYSNSSDSFYI